MRIWMMAGSLMLTACAAVPVRPMAEVTPAPAPDPAKFTTILSAPPSVPPPKLPAPASTGYSAETRAAIARQQALLGEFSQLQAKLRIDEKGNYTDARIVHEPDWAYLLFFKNEPQRTLAKYTKNPRFKAAQGRYTQEELHALVAPWAKRFEAEKIVAGYSLDATYGVAEMMMSVSAAEYRAIAARNGWGAPPDAIKLGFSRDLVIPAIDPRAAPLLRGFAYERRATVMQLEAGFSGRIILDDGCLRLESKTGLLVVFHQETGVGFDADGQLSLINRITGKASGRIGEMLSWAGPNGGTDLIGIDDLKARCGEGPVFNVGNPESKAVFDARYR